MHCLASLWPSGHSLECWKQPLKQQTQSSPKHSLLTGDFYCSLQEGQRSNCDLDARTQLKRRDVLQRGTSQVCNLQNTCTSQKPYHQLLKNKFPLHTPQSSELMTRWEGWGFLQFPTSSSSQASGSPSSTPGGHAQCLHWR